MNFVGIAENVLSTWMGMDSYDFEKQELSSFFSYRFAYLGMLCDPAGRFSHR